MVYFNGAVNGNRTELVHEKQEYSGPEFPEGTHNINLLYLLWPWQSQRHHQKYNCINSSCTNYQQRETIIQKK